MRRVLPCVLAAALVLGGCSRFQISTDAVPPRPAMVMPALAHILPRPPVIDTPKLARSGDILLQRMLGTGKHQP